MTPLPAGPLRVSAAKKLATAFGLPDTHRLTVPLASTPSCPAVIVPAAVWLTPAPQVMRTIAVPALTGAASVIGPDEASLMSLLLLAMPLRIASQPSTAPTVSGWPFRSRNDP